MLGAGIGLKDVETDALKQALRHLHHGELTCPLTIECLTRCGLQYRADALLHHLRGLDERAVRAVLIAVLAERR